jgi:hypothetical protein
MTITEVTETRLQPNPVELLKKIVSNQCCLSLLRFFVLHPNGRFSELAIVHALDDVGRKPDVECALKQLVNEGILNTSTDNTVHYYLLTHEETVRQILLNMAKFDWRQWQVALKII